jgi:hypothetical protein
MSAAANLSFLEFFKMELMIKSMGVIKIQVAKTSKKLLYISIFLSNSFCATERETNTSRPKAGRKIQFRGRWF